MLLCLATAVFATPRPAHADPDPLGNRKKPNLKEAPAPAPAPVRRTDSAQAGTTTTPSTAGGAGESTPGALRAGSDDGTYKLGPRDVVQIEVWNRAEVEYDWRSVTVTEKGTIHLPLLDDVDVRGLTLTELKEKLARLYDAYIIGPQIFCRIAEYNSRQVSVIGEVNRPGRYALQGVLNLSELIAEAGDRRKEASNIVRLIRGRGEDQPPEVRDIDLQVTTPGLSASDLMIQPDDIVTVLPNRNVVYVTGMVKLEGYVEWEEGLTAQQAVILVGGLAEGSAGSRAQLYRTVKGRTAQTKINVKDQKNPVLLEPGDIIHIPKSFF